WEPRSCTTSGCGGCDCSPTIPRRSTGWADTVSRSSSRFRSKSSQTPTTSVTSAPRRKSWGTIFSRGRQASPSVGVPAIHPTKQAPGGPPEIEDFGGWVLTPSVLAQTVGAFPPVVGDGQRPAAFATTQPARRSRAYPQRLTRLDLIVDPAVRLLVEGGVSCRGRSGCGRSAVPG